MGEGLESSSSLEPFLVRKLKVEVRRMGGNPTKEDCRVGEPDWFGAASPGAGALMALDAIEVVIFDCDCDCDCGSLIDIIFMG